MDFSSVPPSGVGSRFEEMMRGLDLSWPAVPAPPTQLTPQPSPPAPSVEVTTAFLRACAVGPVALGDVPRLAEVDPSALGHDARVDLIQAWERVRAQVDGLQQQALGAVIEATQALGLDGDAARHEVGVALRLSPGTAYARTRVAAVLTGRLPATLAALRAGDICYLQAKILAEAVDALPEDIAPDTVARIEARVLAKAPEHTVAETRRAVIRAVIAADPASAQDRHETAARKRAVERHVLSEAMAGWWVTMPAPAEVAAWDELTRRARATQAMLRAVAGCDPGVDALRVDTLLDAILTGEPLTAPSDATDVSATDTSPSGPAPSDTSPSGPAPSDTSPSDTSPSGTAPSGTAPSGTSPSGPAPSGPAPSGTASTPGRPGRLARCRCGGAQTVGVVVDLPTLLGLAENVAELPGYGPIPPALARQLAADRDWVRWTTDPGTRRLLDRGARRYRPSGRLRAHLAAAQRTCRFPGCRRRSEQCDTDHEITYASGGRTVVVNLGPLCRAHHNAKTHGRWKPDYDPDTGLITWTSPLGRTYTTGTDPPLE